MENRNGLLVDLLVTEATGTAEREAALYMLDEHLPGVQRLTLAGDRGYQTRDFIAALRERNVTPHVAMVEHYKSAIDGRTTRHPGYRSAGASANESRRSSMDQDGRALPQDPLRGE